MIYTLCSGKSESDNTFLYNYNKVFPNESLTSKTRRMFKKTTNYLKKTAKSVLSSGRLKTLAFMLLVGGGIAMAQNSAGDYTAGTTALTTVTEEINFG
jgi:hypothetical protein